MQSFDTYLLLLPSGAGGHASDDVRLRVVATTHGYDGWLLGCRYAGMSHGRQRMLVTPLEVLGAPVGEIGAALTKAGALHGAEYVLAMPPAQAGPP